MIEKNIEELCHKLEQALRPHGFHVGLTGSKLYGGGTGKDVDLIVYPHTSPYCDLNKVYAVLVDEGFDFVRYVNRAEDYEDEKHITIWDYQGIRVDIFHLK